MRLPRAIVLALPFTASACGLFLDFDLSDNFGRDEEDDAATTRIEAGSATKDASGADVPVPPANACGIALPPGAINCEKGELSALAATNEALLWIGQRGAVRHELATANESIVTPAPAAYAGGSAVAYEGRLSWGFRTTEPSPIQSCSDDACTPSAKKAVALLIRLAASKAGDFAFSGDVAKETRLESVEAAIGFAVTSAGTTKPITHFAVADTNAFWRTAESKFECPLAADCVDGTFTTGDPPIAARAGVRGYVSVHLDKIEENVNEAFVKICRDPQLTPEGCVTAGSKLPLADANFEPDTRAHLVPAAIAVATDDRVYVGGTNKDGKLEVLWSPAVPGGVSQPVAVVDGTKLVAVAVNETTVFYAAFDGTNSIIYAKPRS